MPVLCRSQWRHYLVIMWLWRIFESPLTEKLWKGYWRGTEESLRTVLKVCGGKQKCFETSIPILGPVWFPDTSACCFSHAVFPLITSMRSTWIYGILLWFLVWVMFWKINSQKVKKYKRVSKFYIFASLYCKILD